MYDFFGKAFEDILNVIFYEIKAFFIQLNVLLISNFVTLTQNSVPSYLDIVNSHSMSVGLKNGGDVSCCEGVVDETQEEGRFANHPIANNNQLVILSHWRFGCHFADVVFLL